MVPGVVRLIARCSFPVPVPPVSVQLAGRLASGIEGLGVAVTVMTPDEATGTTNVLVSGLSSPSSTSTPMSGVRLSTHTTVMGTVPRVTGSSSRVPCSFSGMTAVSSMETLRNCEKINC